ncbi:hypothetical protein T492DRAFT_836220 [Pavlovales sp. CCMP2436]|nr:hypothetical protein T492DRAFT_836220 [Pavlovales sp. CCMP2436]
MGIRTSDIAKWRIPGNTSKTRNARAPRDEARIGRRTEAGGLRSSCGKGRAGRVRTAPPASPMDRQPGRARARARVAPPAPGWREGGQTGPFGRLPQVDPARAPRLAHPGRPHTVPLVGPMGGPPELGTTPRHLRRLCQHLTARLFGAQIWTRAPWARVRRGRGARERAHASSDARAPEGPARPACAQPSATAHMPCPPRRRGSRAEKASGMRAD